MIANIVPLTNVGLLSAAIGRALQRPVGLPGLVVMYGPSGLGKSVSAAYAANQYRAYYVECRHTWTKKAFLQAILREMSIKPAAYLYEMVDQVAEQLSRSGRPLIVDDVQYLLDKSAADVLTDLYNASQGTIVLIGEENVSSSLGKLERLHNRVLEWVPAQSATLGDVQRLASATYPGVAFAEDLLTDLNKAVKGCLRRINVNLHRVSSEAAAAGKNQVDLAYWGKRGWFTGQAPDRRGA